QRGARLVQVRQREVIVELLAEALDRLRSARDGQRRVRRRGDRDARLADGDAVDQSGRVLLDRRERCAAAVRNRRRDDDHTLRLDVALVERAVDLAKLLVQHVERELDRMENVAAPVLLGILLRMRMLERDAEWT